MWVFQILNHMSDMKVTHCVLFGKTDQRGDSANSIHFVTSWMKSMKFPPRPWKFTSSKMVRRLFAKVIQMVPTAKFPRVTVRVAVVECPKFQEFQVPISLWWRRESSVSWRIMLLTATLGQSLSPLWRLTEPKIFQGSDGLIDVPPRPGQSFGESVLLLFGERNATANHWIRKIRGGEKLFPLGFPVQTSWVVQVSPKDKHLFKWYSRYSNIMWSSCSGVFYCNAEVCARGCWQLTPGKIFTKNDSPVNCQCDRGGWGARAYGMEGMQVSPWVWIKTFHGTTRRVFLVCSSNHVKYWTFKYNLSFYFRFWPCSYLFLRQKIFG